ncbi:MAG: tRNA epoxyqueuosine(34) reductase QueG [Novosphingobium sp.]
MVKADTLAALKADLQAEAARLGFADCGIAPARDDALFGERLDDWLADGLHGEMDWMEARAHHRRGPQSLWPEAQSVIALAMSYAPASDPLALAGHPDRARVSVYAQGADYHDTVKKALKALARWLVEAARQRGLGERQVKVFVDTAPVPEKPLAAAAGLGWQGKHTNLVSRTHGSWLFLGAIYADLDFAPDAPAEESCGSCRACHDACPTEAFTGPFRIDARRCVSYLTIEHKGPIPEEFRAKLGNRIYGCDDCLAACPWNKFASEAQAIRAFLPRAELAAPRLADLLALDDPGFRALFSGSPIKRIGRNRFIRNCLYAAGNSGDASLLPQVEALACDPDPVVAEAAEWAFAKLRLSGPSL